MLFTILGNDGEKVRGSHRRSSCLTCGQHIDRIGQKWYNAYAHLEAGNRVKKKMITQHLIFIRLHCLKASGTCGGKTSVVGLLRAIHTIPDLACF